MAKEIMNVREIVAEEREAAKEACPPFCSTKEGWAEMLKEFDALKLQTKVIKKGMDAMWDNVKSDITGDAISVTYAIEDEAVKAAEDAIQLAVKAQRFREAFERKGDGEWHY